MYFDDAHITSWKSEGPSAQWAFSQLNVLLGTPFAEDKRQACASSGTFLGLDYNFETVNTTNSVTFWARERLQDKVSNMLDDAEFHQRLSPAQASKLYGVLNFLENGMFGRVGCGGLQAIKHHQYGRSYRLSPELKQSFALIRTVLACQPKRQFWLTHKRWPRVVAASDAALDAPREGSGGYLILWGSPTERPREAFVALIPNELYDWFTPGTQKIAQLEMLMIAHALVKRAQMFRHRRGYWFIDNVASLMCLVRGRSDSADLERISHFIHIVLFALESVLFWEYIPSKSNWADPISRLGDSDPWHVQHSFTRFESELPIFLLDLPFLAAVKSGSSTPSCPSPATRSEGETSEAVTVAPPVFTFTLRRADDVALGLNAAISRRNELVVESVTPWTALDSWNRFQVAGPGDRSVYPGDRVLSVNGHYCPFSMLQECQMKQLLKMEIMRAGGLLELQPLPLSELI
eukprot:s763_g6.t1